VGKASKIAQGQEYDFPERATQDCYRGEATVVVEAFCHEDGSRLDTSSYCTLFKLLNAIGKFEDHPQRIWNSFAIAHQFQLFKESPEWLKFQKILDVEFPRQCSASVAVSVYGNQHQRHVLTLT
jgi:hypothetical protein